VRVLAIACLALAGCWLDEPPVTFATTRVTPEPLWPARMSHVLNVDATTTDTIVLISAGRYEGVTYRSRARIIRDRITLLGVPDGEITILRVGPHTAIGKTKMELLEVVRHPLVWLQP
jgi:hypothetical protein